MEDEVKQDYLEALNDLTFNSRPIIQGLTTIASENAEYGSAIAAALDEHVTSVPPNQKLPALYLMDSITKNVLNPYADLFASRVYRMFTDTFAASPEPVRIKLGELFNTWTQNQPQTGQTLFPHEILRQLDEFLQRASRKQQGGPASSTGRLTQSGLQVEINRSLNALNGNDKETEYQRSVLQRLQGMLASSAADPATLPAIQQQLEALKSRAAYNSRVPRGKQKNESRGRDRGPRDRRRGNDDRGDRGGRGGGSATGANTVAIAQRQPRDRDSTPPVASGESAVLPANLLDSLKSAGLLSSSNGLLNPLAALATPPAASFEFVGLTNADIEKPRLHLVAQLYSKLPLQCATCGKRFPDTPEGQQAKQAEADWHFRVNKAIRDGQASNRTWYLSAEAWIAYREDDDESEDKEASAKEVAINYEELAQKYVPVPADPGDGMCPICQEKFSTVWSEEAEEWVWMNAVEVQGHMLNATCYADPQNLSIVQQVLGNDTSVDLSLLVKTEPKTEPEIKTESGIKTESSVKMELE